MPPPPTELISLPLVALEIEDRGVPFGFRLMMRAVAAAAVTAAAAAAAAAFKDGES